jgi:hypothetical protein
MYRDRAQWTKVRCRILTDQIPIRQVVRETGISRKTIRKMLVNRWPKPYGPRSPGNSKSPRPESIVRTNRTVRLAANPNKRAKTKNIAFEWMRSVLQNQFALSALRPQVGDLPELGELVRRLYDGRLTERNRSMVILANRHGLTSSVTCSFLGIDRHTYRRYLRKFERAGVLGYSPTKPTVDGEERFVRTKISEDRPDSIQFFREGRVVRSQHDAGLPPPVACQNLAHLP